MRRTGYTYSNRLDLRHRGSIFPTSHDSRGSRTNRFRQYHPKALSLWNSWPPLWGRDIVHRVLQQIHRVGGCAVVHWAGNTLHVLACRRRAALPSTVPGRTGTEGPNWTCQDRPLYVARHVRRERKGYGWLGRAMLGCSCGISPGSMRFSTPPQDGYIVSR